MKSKIFSSGKYLEIAGEIKEFLSAERDEFLSAETAKSTRAVGDALQVLLADNFEALLGTDLCAKYSSDFARRAMADLAFEDHDGFYYVVDVKTHRLGTAFSMPNLTSVERLARFYEDDRNYFVILLVAYELDGLRVRVENVVFMPIEFLGWDCLTIGALGWGQVQIADANRITVSDQYPRKNWMIEMCEVLLEHYPKEISKIKERIERFKQVKEYWESRPD